MNYDALFVNPNGHTARADFIPALIVIGAAIAFFAFMVTGRTAHFCMLVLMYPFFVLLARRMRDAGQPAWLLLVPLVFALLAFAIQLGYASLGATLDGAMRWLALAAAAGFALVGCVKK